MKIPIILVLIYFFFESAKASLPDSTRTELFSLLKERKVLSDEYYTSLEKKSGFFGNRTKNDLRESQEKLVAIVKEDNKIMNALNRTLDFRNFEKQNMVYDANSFEDRIRNLSILNDTLNKQVIALKNENKIYHSDLKRHQIYFALFILSIISIFGVWLRQFFRK